MDTLVLTSADTPLIATHFNIVFISVLLVRKMKTWVAMRCKKLPFPVEQFDCHLVTFCKLIITKREDFNKSSTNE